MIIAIVPAYNEEKTIGSVVRDLFSHVDDVVVVDDGSLDATGERARAAGATVLSHELNRGQGAALETGHEYARRAGADYVLHFDADGQMRADDIPGAYALLVSSGADILLGSRFLGGSVRVPFFKRSVLFPLGRIVNRLSGATYVSDVHNGFRLLTKNALEHIRLSHDGMAHATEILSLIRTHNLHHVEHPVKVVYHEYGQGFFGGLRIVRDLLVGKFV